MCFPTVQEPVKSRAPQLHLEYRFYKTLGTTGRVPEPPLLLSLNSCALLGKWCWFDCCGRSTREIATFPKQVTDCNTVTGPKKSCIPKTQVLIFRTECTDKEREGGGRAAVLGQRWPCITVSYRWCGSTWEALTRSLWPAHKTHATLGRRWGRQLLLIGHRWPPVWRGFTCSSAERFLFTPAPSGQSLALTDFKPVGRLVPFNVEALFQKMLLKLVGLCHCSKTTLNGLGCHHKVTF